MTNLKNMEPTLNPEVRADEGGFKLTVEHHKKYGKMLHELNYVLCHSIKRHDPQVNNKIKAQTYLIKLRSVLEDVMFMENPGLEYDALNHYYPGSKVKLEEI